MFKSKITKITEKVPQITTLPDGLYTGIWGGYIIVISYNNKTYELTTEMGIRGFGFKVMVDVTNGIATYEELKD